MKIFSSELYENQLKEILQELLKIDFDSTQKFKLYLDTIIINIPTKASKYKKSIYYDDENVKDIEYEDYTVTFHIDTNKENYLILSIYKKTHK